MNKYQEALKDINTRNEYFKQNIKVHIGRTTMSAIEELVDKEIELQSRKDKLIVGSEWECVAGSFYGFWGDYVAIKKGTTVKIGSVNGRMISFDRGAIVPTDQFLLCFKPKEK